MDWHNYLKRYVWNDDKTPYLVAVDKLTRQQANSEIFLYTLCLAVPGGLIAAAAIADIVQNGNMVAAWPGLYACTVCIAALLLGARKSMWSAFYSLSVPVVMLAYLYFRDIQAGNVRFDHYVLIVVMLLWIRYTVRVVAITKAYPGMADKPPEA